MTAVQVLDGEIDALEVDAVRETVDRWRLHLGRRRGYVGRGGGRDLLLFVVVYVAARQSEQHDAVEDFERDQTATSDQRIHRLFRHHSIEHNIAINKCEWVGRRLLRLRSNR